jgi:drug/metabolite transporter (DMT)-like permease
VITARATVGELAIDGNPAGPRDLGPRQRVLPGPPTAPRTPLPRLRLGRVPLTVGRAPGTDLEEERAITPDRPDRLTLALFGSLCVLVGANAVGIAISNRELAPLWGATLRIGLGALLFWALVVVRRSPLPRGRALAGAVVYGLVGFAAFLSLVYLGLVRAPAGLASIVLALGPLVSLVLAVLHGLERFRWQGVVGAAAALAGIVIAYGGIGRPGVPPESVLAIFAGAVCIAEVSILLKRMPPADPVAVNAVATTVGAAVLLGVSAAVAEPWAWPAIGSTWAALGYLASLGTVGVFLILVYLLRRWHASAVAYHFVLAPFAAVALQVLFLGEGITPVFVAGGALALVGVWIGALSPAAR